MGRARGGLAAAASSATVGRSEKQRFTLAGLGEGPALSLEHDELTVDDVGTPEHVRRLEAYCRARSGKNVRVQFHSSDEGTAFTDMQGLIAINNDRPKDANDPRVVALVMNAQSRHEMCHVDYTDPEVFFKFSKELERIGKETGLVTSKHVHSIWNSLEDGMIEERERTENANSYMFLSARNKLDPKVGGSETLDEEQAVPAPDGYIPTDAQGNKLKVVQGYLTVGPDGKLTPVYKKKLDENGNPMKLVKLPAGTELSAWSKKPIDKVSQMSSALLAASLPEYEVGDLHPDVQKALDECQPHIDAAVRGNTSDCVTRALKIREILEKHDLCPEETMDPEAQQQLIDQMQQMMMQQPSAPQMLGDPSQSSGQGQSNPMPQQQMPQMSQQMQQAVGQDDSSQGGESGEGQSGEGQSGEGQSGEGQSGEGQSGEGQSGEGQSGQGQSGQGGQGGQSGGQGGQQSGGGQGGGGDGADGEAPGQWCEKCKTVHSGSHSHNKNNGQGGDSGEGRGADGDKQEGQGAGGGDGSKDKDGAGKSGDEKGPGGGGDAAGKDAEKQNGQGAGGGDGKDGDKKDGEGAEGQGAGKNGQDGQDADGEGKGSGDGKDGDKKDGEGQGAGDGKDGQDAEGKDGKGQGASKDGQDGDKKDGKGKGAGDGKDGDEENGAGQGAGGGDGKDKDGDKKDGKGKGGQDAGDGANQNSGGGSGGSGVDTMPEDNPSAAQGPGGREGAGGYNSDRIEAARSLPEGQREKNDSEGRGHANQGDIENLLQQEERDLQQPKVDQAQAEHNAATVGLRKGRFEGNNWNLPPGHFVQSQKELRSATRAHGSIDEDKGLHQYGRQLAQEIRNLNAENRRPVTNLRRGRRPSTRKLSAAMAGREDVMENPGVSQDQKVRLDVTIDRSGSVLCNQSNNKGQQQMAKMFGYMDKEARGNVVTSIYGWDGSGGNNRTGHYAYKEAHSQDLTAIDGLVGTGGGGTPTADGVEFSRARLARAKEPHRVMAVITDGGANDNPAAREQVNIARREGITVLGLAFECDGRLMDEIFGPGNWAKLDTYQRAPRIVGRLITQLAKKKGR